MTYFLEGRGFFLFRQPLLGRLRAIVEKSRAAVDLKIWRQSEN